MVTASTLFPEEHASLSDGTTTVKFKFTDGDGNVNPRAFKASPYPRTALKTTTGESKYSDLEPPYFAIAQDDFTGGRGNEDFESDTSRYFDGHWVDTSKESGVILGGRETYTTGYRSVDQAMPGSMTFQGAYVATRFLAVSFVASASYTSYQCEIWLKKIGGPSAIQVELWTDVSSAPGAKLASQTVSPSAITTDTVSLLKNFVWTGSPGLTATTTYWVVIDGGTVANATNHWAIGVDAATAGKKSSDESSWSATTYSPYYRITPAKADFVGKFFEYKRGFYMVTQPDAGGNSALYINGDRGTADSNTGAKTTLIDATKSWTADEWIGCRVEIISGTGSNETQNWRTITDNDGTTLTVSPAWNIEHTTSTKYVILGSDKWTLVDADIGGYCYDVAVSGEFIHFAVDASGLDKIITQRYYSKGGVWSVLENVDTADAHRLLAINHPDSKTATLYCGWESTRAAYIYRAQIPNAIGDIYHSLGTLVECNTPWDSRSVANVTQGTISSHTKIIVGADHTTGIVAVKNLDPPVDITRGLHLGFEIQSSASGGLDANDLALVYDDVENLGQTWSPDKVFQAIYSENFLPSKVFLEADFDGTPAFTDLTELYDGDANTSETISFTTDDYLWIGADKPFNKINVTMDGTDNAIVCATRYYEYYSAANTGTDLTNVSDGTISTANTPLEQTGVISFDHPPVGGSQGWKMLTVNSVEAYWIRIRYQSADLTPSVVVKATYLTVDEKANMEPSYVDLTRCYDGTSNGEILNWIEPDYIWIGHGTKFNKITVTLGTTKNDVASVMTAKYYNGYAMTALTITDSTDVAGDTMKESEDITFTIPNDWELYTVNSVETYWIRLDVSVDLTAEIDVNDITVTRQNNVSLNIGACTAATWTWQELTIVPEAYPLPDDTAIASVGINVAIDNGLQAIQIKDIHILAETPYDEPDACSKLPAGSRVNSMIAYSGNVDDPVENPWIITNQGVYELQTQNDDQLVPIPLKELASLQSSENGLGRCVNGTYLYFNIGEKIERYFNRTLDDIGPDRDEGLPTGRPGIPKSLASYPGRVYAGIDAGTSGTSSALALDGTSWHEVYRAPRTGERIRSVQIQAIPGTNVDRLWISMGSDILWVPISLSPYTETDFTYTHEGSLETSYIHANLLDVVKIWKSLKVFIESISVGNYYVVADYKADTDSSWTEIGTFDTAPVEEIDIASTLPQAKRIKYRLRFITNDVSESPRLKAIVTEGVAFVPVKNQYSWTFAIKQTTENISLSGIYDATLTSLQEYDKLRDWANDGQPLTLRHHSTLHDNKTVFLDPISVSPIHVVDHGGIENHVASITCIEV